jgi:hypothetical protein
MNCPHKGNRFAVNGRGINHTVKIKVSVINTEGGMSSRPPMDKNGLSPIGQGSS